ncbi:MAG: Na/Pi cotransporter family protein [Cyclonatronaceae bacterium]
MTYSFFDFLQLIGSLGIFIYGMKILSDGLQKVAGSKLRAILKGMTTTRITGILTGFLATVMLQSSTTTTVMVVSFVNAGLLTFIEATGVIMGANIGTTLTAWMVSVLGFKFSITPVAVSMIGISFPFLFFGKPKLRNLAEAVIGFGILFIGLDFLKDSVPSIQDNPEILEFLNRFTDYGFFTTIIFIAVGTLLTLITQSSSAATAITLVMLAQGWISFPIAAAMVLGENIGTTVTANIAALIGNVHAKRAARFHFAINIIGVTWMLILFPWFLDLVDWGMHFITDTHTSVYDLDETSRINATLALSLFHTLFNVFNVTLLFAFVPLITRLVIRFQPSKDGADEQFRLKYITSGLMSSPELSIAQAQKEVELMAKLVDKISFNVSALLFKKKNKQKFLDKIAKREEITDVIEMEVADYLSRISTGNMTRNASEKVRSILSMINDLERIADIFYQISRSYEKMMTNDIELPKEAMKEIKGMTDLVHEAIKEMRSNLLYEPDNVDLTKALELESEIDILRETLRIEHYKRLESGIYSVQAGVVYLDFINRLERIGDHILNINEGAKGIK